MRLSSFERQSRRRSTYYVVAFFGIVVLGGVTVYSILAATKQRVRTHLYHDPELTLRYVFAQNETKWLFIQKHATYASIDELVNEGMISEEFREGPVEGYRYRVVTATASSFLVTAEPEGPMPSPTPEPPDPRNPRALPAVVRPRQWYRVDESHTIRADAKGPATNESPVVWSPRDLTSR